MKTAIFSRWGVPNCRQLITGLTAQSDDELLKNLNLPGTVQLSVCTGDPDKTFDKDAVNGINEYESLANF